MHIYEMESRIEDVVRSEVLKHHSLDWDENAITHGIMIQLRNYFPHVTLTGTGLPLTIKWEIYKLRGNPERDYGDIGVLVRRRLPSGQEIEGAGFLEAKVRSLNSTAYDQFRTQQLDHFITTCRHSRLLLYDYEGIPVLDSPWWPRRYRRRHVSQLPTWYPSTLEETHGGVIPIDLAKTLGRNDESLYQFCHSMAFQFTRRYFQLHDLDFGNQAIDSIKGYSNERGGPVVLVVVSVTSLGGDMPESWLPSKSDYEPLE